MFLRRFFAFAVLLALMLLPASAVEAVPPEARFLSELGLLRGTDKGLEPDAPLTRAQGATLLVRLLGREAEALAQTRPTPFSDTAGWAAPYIGWLYAHALTNGTSATAFSPQREITYRQFSLFLTRALGGGLTDAPPAELEPTGAELVAAGVTAPTAVFDAPITRGKAAELCVRALRLSCVNARETLAQRLISEKVLGRDALIAAAPLLGGDTAQTLYRPSDGLLRRFGVDYRYGQESGLWQEGERLYLSLGGVPTVVDTGMRSGVPGWRCEAVRDGVAYLFKLQADATTYLLMTCNLSDGVINTLGGPFEGDIGALAQYAVSVGGQTILAGDRGALALTDRTVRWLHRLPLAGQGGTPLCAAANGVVCLLADGRLLEVRLDGTQRELCAYLRGSALTVAPTLLGYDGATLRFSVARTVEQTMGGSGAAYVYTYAAVESAIRCTNFSCESTDPGYFSALLKALQTDEQTFVRRQIEEEQRALDAQFK